jgi:hypothetical protein
MKLLFAVMMLFSTMVMADSLNDSTDDLQRAHRNLSACAQSGGNCDAQVRAENQAMSRSQYELQRSQQQQYQSDQQTIRDEQLRQQVRSQQQRW